MAVHTFLGQYTDVTTDLESAVGFIRDRFGDQLGGYEGDNVEYILSLLNQKYNQTSEADDTSDTSHRRRRHTAVMDLGALIGDHSLSNMQTSEELAKDSFLESASNLWDKYLRHDYGRSVPKRHQRRTWVHLLTGAQSQTDGHFGDMQISVNPVHERVRRGSSGGDSAYAQEYDGNSTAHDHYDRKYKKKSLSSTLLKLAHIMHYISIAILGVFVIQVGTIFWLLRLRGLFPAGLVFCDSLLSHMRCANHMIGLGFMEKLLFRLSAISVHPQSILSNFLRGQNLSVYGGDAWPLTFDFSHAGYFTLVRHGQGLFQEQNGGKSHLVTPLWHLWARRWIAGAPCWDWQALNCIDRSNQVVLCANTAGCQTNDSGIVRLGNHHCLSPRGASSMRITPPYKALMVFLSHNICRIFHIEILMWSLYWLQPFMMGNVSQKLFC